MSPCGLELPQGHDNSILHWYAPRLPMNLGIERRIPTCAGTEIKHLRVSTWFSTQSAWDTMLRRNARTFSNSVSEPASYSYSGWVYSQNKGLITQDFIDVSLSILKFPFIDPSAGEDSFHYLHRCLQPGRLSRVAFAFTAAIIIPMCHRREITTGCGPGSI